MDTSGKLFFILRRTENRCNMLLCTLAPCLQLRGSAKCKFEAEMWKISLLVGIWSGGRTRISYRSSNTRKYSVQFQPINISHKCDQISGQACANKASRLTATFSFDLKNVPAILTFKLYFTETIIPIL